MPSGTHYRLILYQYGLGPLELSRVYADLRMAVEVGEGLFGKLEGKPHKRPYRIDVIDVWTRETVTRLAPDTPKDAGVCAACGAPLDPFGKVDE